MTTSSSQLPAQHVPRPAWQTWATAAVVIALLYLLILCVGMIGSGFKLASGGEDTAESFISNFADHPLLALMVSVFATALVQSSSTVTTVIVGLVAGGAFTPEQAVPMVMGANIGTTVTNTLVSLSHITRPQEFRRAFAAATVHDFFNLMAVCLFLPLELMTGILAKSAHFLTNLISTSGVSGGDYFNPIAATTKPVIKKLAALLNDFSPLTTGIVLGLIGVIVIFITIFLLGKVLRRQLHGRAERIFHAAIGRGPVTSIAAGTVITIGVQSSSTTTSLVIPMAGAGLVRLEQIFPFTLGANIGTCITGLIAATGGAVAGLQIALVHLLFNIFGTLVIYGLPFLRAIPLRAARWLAELAERRRLLAISYILSVFFVVPGLLLYATSGDDVPPDAEQTAPALNQEVK
jgi:solute carrier family 34 (sodium-dependent phosphate cotransporter)